MLKAVPVHWGLLAAAVTGALVMAKPGVQDIGAQTSGAQTSGAHEQRSGAPPSPERSPLPRARTPQELAYYSKLAEYKRVRGAYDKEASAYWDLISDKRTARRKERAQGRAITLDHYVLDQPPVYRGPSEPVPPPSLIKPRPPGEAAPTPAPGPPPIPVVADFLEQARVHFGFSPDTPSTELEFKRAYAQAALRAGISKDQAVRIYGFEASGNGRYDVQAGLESPGSKRRAISTALGYNQLLVTNTISLLAEHDGKLVAALSQRGSEAGPARRAQIEAKVAALKQMIRFAQSVPKKWSDQDDLAKTPKGWAVHALNLDVDVGPLLQAQKLADSLVFAERKGFTQRLTAAELEMMNLMGDGSGFDVISMPDRMRGKVPTSNMFQRGGYERNPVARRNNTVEALLSATDAKMDSQTDLPGAREMDAAFDAMMPANAAVR